MVLVFGNAAQRRFEGRRILPPHTLLPCKTPTKPDLAEQVRIKMARLDARAWFEAHPIKRSPG